MLNVPTLPPGLPVPRHCTWIASPVTLPTGVAVCMAPSTCLHTRCTRAAAPPARRAGGAARG
eukprot:7051213-Prymnesium_polylepis.1